MTYRRLFHMLMIGSSLVLAMVWWGSFRQLTATSIDSQIPPMHLGVHLVHATLFLDYSSEPPLGLDFFFDSGPPLQLAPDLPPRLMGNFYRSEGFSQSSPGPCYPFYMWGVPVWVPYLLFIASAWGFCRMMERRAQRE